MSRRPVVLALVATALACPVAARQPPSSLCQSGEAIVFSCVAGAKIVSVCGTGYPQYRFGKPGEVEMSLPEGRVAPAAAASGEVVPFSGGGGVWLRFAKPPYAYVVYDGIGNWGPGGAKKAIAGVVVEQNGRKIANIRCTAPAHSSLSPDWFGQTGIKTNNQDFEFPTED